VALVLGCSPTVGGGYTNPFFATRIQAAAELFRLGKVDYLLVSGDNRRRDYDEPSAMKEALVAAGVPQNRIYCDYAGRRTLDSVVRAGDVFGQGNIIVVSQEFHNQRAIFIAQHRGIDAIGFNAPDVDRYSAQSVFWRE
jgi:SanA protein